MTATNNILFPAQLRGEADHGWLKAKHTFSFAGYYDPTRMGFGVIRVINDDEIAPAMGFGEHAHDNMVIITIPLEGKLQHKDSTGHEGMITPGEVQIMSAGRGIRHSEFNASKTEVLKLLQIWVKTAQQNAEPRYDQKRFWSSNSSSKRVTMIDPNAEEGALVVLQNVKFEMVWLDANESFELPLLAAGHSLFLMVLEGSVQLDGQRLNRRDAMGLIEAKTSTVASLTSAQVLLIHQWCD